MSTDLAAHRADTVARLRAAGCVFAEDEADLLLTTAHSAAQLRALVDRRAQGVPLEHVVGWALFAGLRVAVAPGVFVPRARSEALVREAVARIRPGATVADLCAGSGALGVAIAARVGPIDLYAADLDPVSVECARGNLEPWTAQVYQGDLFAALPVRQRGRFEVVVANAPYVPTPALGLMPPEARLYEPRSALDGGTDGLDVLRRLALQAPGWLAPGGYLLVEAGEDQVPAAVAVFEAAGLSASVAYDEDLEATVLSGQWSPAASPGPGRTPR